MFYIYILKCKNGKYYVSIDNKNYNNINDEFINNINSSWVVKYKPVSILQVYTRCSIDEIDKYTEMYMDIYGIDNVRGGGNYNNINIDKKTKTYLKYKLNNINTKVIQNKNKKIKKMRGPVFKKNKLSLNNYIKNYNYEDEFINNDTDYDDTEKEYIHRQRNFIKDYSNNFVENIIIKQKATNCATNLVNDIMTECVTNVNLINEFDIININKEEHKEMENEEKNKSYLYNICSYFGIY